MKGVSQNASTVLILGTLEGTVPRLLKSVLTCLDYDEMDHKAINCVTKETNHSSDESLFVRLIAENSEESNSFLKKAKINNCDNVQALTFSNRRYIGCTGNLYSFNFGYGTSVVPSIRVTLLSPLSPGRSFTTHSRTMPQKYLTDMGIENVMKNLDEENFDDNDSES
ncbi:hypothetical protein AVEN_115560-1 [Araneus ventricosus]|uniref:Uncharacterized protein n=1 Tax=Araneus ventricosus TaxID=182803 RepID=A0A4Y2NJB5_ARAVE|nr:hypothetical protein AVEN_115560-1 [Araneus ventricosus]